MSNMMYSAFFMFICMNAFYNVENVKASPYHNDIAIDNDSNDWIEFNRFVKRFNKEYRTFDEMKERFSIFKQNLVSVISHNKQSFVNFTLGINQFSDLTSDEFRNNFVGNFYDYQTFGCKSYYNSNVNLPSSFDWRQHNAVTSVKDQGQCGSCWAFSSTGSIEGAWAISRGELIDLSEQELVDCANGYTYGSHGCEGGQMDGGFKYVINYGICSASEYPYTSGTTRSDDTCKKCNTVATISACSDVMSKDQLSLKNAVYQQPVSVAIEADTRYFQSYSSGVLDSATCGTTLDHGVLVVGYGEENGNKYWLVKNSWGASWGENGYVKILRTDSKNDAGVCGIAMQPSFPIVSISESVEDNE